MKRLALVAAAGIALFNRPVLDELLQSPTRLEGLTPLPSWWGASDVTATCWWGLARGLA
jgi:hypothetical protein